MLIEQEKRQENILRESWEGHAQEAQTGGRKTGEKVLKPQAALYFLSLLTGGLRGVALVLGLLTITGFLFQWVSIAFERAFPYQEE